MAFGTVGQAHKFYFYAQQADGGSPLFLVELVLDLSSHLARATLKSPSSAALPRFMRLFKELVHKAVP
jgi:hypothetical protein